MCIRDRNMTVWRGGAAQRKGSGLDSSELYSNLIQIVDLFRGKSRLKIDLLMKEFMLHARTEGAAPPSSHEARVNCQGFRNFFKKKEIRDTELVDRLFRATDLDRNGQVSFTEFRRAIHKLRSGLEGRIDMYVRLFDGDEKGSLDRAEVGMMVSMGMPGGSAEQINQHVAYLFAKMDEDHSGTLTTQEILKGIATNRKLSDSLERAVI
eukprot:TRINITY_DN4459_c0_g1_i1.p1 TRINITY_DN4459_c0_g1~~TRINITY_DN4459_c0_g1_i1.p1  ORF type:complete len:208 (-),score=75.89 TRINITY_DN4459_c0_g1_i1:160-783(-)